MSSNGDVPRHGLFRLLAARLSSQVADGWFQAGLAGSLLFNPEKQANALAIATGFAMLLLPYSALGPFVGVLLDRWQRRTSLTVANLLRAAFVVPSAALIWGGEQGLPFALLVLVVIAMNRFFLAGLSAALPHVVPNERLVAANSAAATLGTVCYAAGLGSATLLVSAPAFRLGNHGYAAIALLGSAGYLVSAALLRSLFTRHALGPDETDRRVDRVRDALVDVAREMAASVRHLAERRTAGYAVLVQAGHRALYGALSLATLLLFTRFFTTDSADSIPGLGLVVAAGGVGAVVAAVVTPIVCRRMPSWAWISVQLGGASLTLLVLGPTFLAPLIIAGVLLVNVASQGIKIVTDTTLQNACDDTFRGRVFSVNDTAFNATFVGGLFLAATLLPPNGRSLPLLLIIAIGYAVLGGWYAIIGRRWATRSVRQPQLASAMSVS